MIRVLLPQHLRALAHVGNEVEPKSRGRSRAGRLDALEARYPMLRGTISATGYVAAAGVSRFFALRGGSFARAPPELRYRTRLRREWSR